MSKMRPTSPNASNLTTFGALERIIQNNIIESGLKRMRKKEKAESKKFEELDTARVMMLMQQPTERIEYGTIEVESAKKSSKKLSAQNTPTVRLTSRDSVQQTLL